MPTLPLLEANMNCIKCGKEIPEGAPYCCWCGKKQKQEPRKTLKRANGTGSVYKLSGRRTRPWVAAKNKLIIGYYAKKTDALDALARLVGKDISERYNMTFKEVFEEWRQEHYREIGKSGAVSYDRAFEIYSELHERKFRDLRTIDFQSAIDSNAGKAHSTLSKYKQLTTQLSEWAVREEIVSRNFAKYVKLPEERKKEKEIFSEEDIEKLSNSKEEAAKIILMLIYTGMRIGELFTLPISGYHETYLIGGEKTEAGRNRVIPIRPEGRALFAEMNAAATGDLLISGYKGAKDISNFRKREYYPLLERLHIERKTPHATRHTFASWAVANDVQPEYIQKMLGHSRYETTANTYVHADVESLVKAVER